MRTTLAHKASALAILISCLALAAAAQAAKVSYVDGQAEMKTGASWTRLSEGDGVPGDATIRITGKASVEIQWSRGKLRLSRAGLYSMRDMITMSQRLESTGAVKALSGKLASLMGGVASNQAVVMGVRGADKSSEGSLFVENEADIPFAEGKSRIASGDYGAAVEQLAMARDYAGPDQLPEILFTLGYAQALAGDEAAAAESLDGLDPKGASWAHDYYILEARILVDSFAWDSAIALLTGDGAVLNQDTNRATGAWFLLGLAYRGKGDVVAAKAQFARVAAAESGSDLGKAAAAMIAAQ